MDPSLSLAS